MRQTEHDQVARPPAAGAWLRELALVVLGYAALTAIMVSSLAFRLGTVARLDNADTRMLIWNVAWVARTLLVDPLHVYDANIFYPHRGTLAYSESNLGAGILAIPVYWATENPYAAHNVVVLFSFVLSGTCTYYLVRYLVRDRRAAAIAGICFAFSPYAFSHLPHVHLLMTFGFPLSLLAFHRLADRPTAARGLMLGVVMAIQALFCGYYGVFVGLVVGFMVIAVAVVRRTWQSRQYWIAVAVAATVAIVCAIPLFLPYIRLQRETGFSRPFADAWLFSATWRTYFASSAYAHAWMLRLIEKWNEVLFPGFVAAIGGAAGFVIGWMRGGRTRELAILYGSVGALAFWASLGPAAGLYRVLYAVLPPFSLMRAPSRFGLLVTLAASVLAAVAIAAWLARLQRSRSQLLGACAVAAVALLELSVPLRFSPVPPVAPAYRILGTLPRGPVLELPFYSARAAEARTRYMLNSTSHWMPLVNGYSSHTPREFIEKTPALAGFPSPEAFRILQRDGVRYVVFHLTEFSPPVRADLTARIDGFSQYLARRYADERTWLYEIVDFPR